MGERSAPLGIELLPELHARPGIQEALLSADPVRLRSYLSCRHTFLAWLAKKQGKLTRLRQTLEAQVDIERRPVAMILMNEFNLQYLVHSCLTKPREIIVGQEIFLVLNENPQAKLINI